MKDERCRATTRLGAPCAAQVVDGGYCAWHTQAPAWAEKRRRWSAAGGKARSNQARAAKHLGDEAMGAEELGASLAVVFRRVVAGSLEPKVGTAAATIAKVLLDLRAAGELEERLGRLEAAAALSGPRRIS